MKTYITFGQGRVHSINGRTFDKDCVAVINHVVPGDGRKLAFEFFGDKFCFEYPEDHFDFDSMRFFPRGFIKVN